MSKRKKLHLLFELNICEFIKCYFFQIVDSNCFTKLSEIDPHKNVVDWEGLGVSNSNKDFIPRRYLEVHDKED